MVATMQPHLYMLINTFPSMLKNSPLQGLQVFRDFADSRATFPLISFQIVTLLLNTQHITAICLSLPFKSNQVTFRAPGPQPPVRAELQFHTASFLTLHALSQLSGEHRNLHCTVLQQQN